METDLGGHLISYDLARGLHIIAVIAWISGLLMLPRFYAYISGSQPGGELEAKMITASRSLRLIILGPSMVVAWAFGLFLLTTYLIPDWERSPVEIAASVPVWFWAKLALVVALSAYHGFLVGQGKRLAAGQRRFSETFWRRLSEVPFIIAIAVVLLATLEP